MMVASPSVIKHEQSHHLGPSLHNMAYRIRPLNDVQSHDQDSVFISHANSFNPIMDSRCTHPASSSTYKGSLDSTGMNENDAFTMSSGAESFFTNSANQFSTSPIEEKLSRSRPFSISSIYDGLSRSPTRLSPPCKRMITGPSPSISPPNTTDIEMMNSRFSTSGFEPGTTTTDVVMISTHCNDAKPIPKLNLEPEFLNTASSDYYKSTYTPIRNDIKGNEMYRPPSPSNTRHLSQSSTHSSSSSTNSKPTTPSKTSSHKSSKTPSKLQQQTPVYCFDDDDDDSWKICQVCNDKATGYHFNALTCEGCKGFFRRSMKNLKTFNCPYSGNCIITKSNRRQCQSCRLAKCLRTGMKKECIMSHSEIQMKKNLMLNNRIKKNIIEWKATEYSNDKMCLIEGISKAHQQTNQPPDFGDGGIVTEQRHPDASPASTGSGFSDLINQITEDIVATAPGQTGASRTHMQHFSAIMEYSIKEIIKFCKKIPTFTRLSLKDQITLLKSGCTEILFIKANYTYDRVQEALMCGPGKYYTKESFILGGMSEEYTDCYLKFHHDLSHMMLDDTELACICAATLFSSDRDELEDRVAIETQQEEIVNALQAYSENTHHCRIRFPKIMAYLTRLRTLNWHISITLQRLQNTESGKHITPLVLEVVPTV